MDLKLQQTAGIHLVEEFENAVLYAMYSLLIVRLIMQDTIRRKLYQILKQN